MQVFFIMVLRCKIIAVVLGCTKSFLLLRVLIYATIAVWVLTIQSCLSWIPAQSSVYVVLAVQRYGHPCIISFLWSSVEHITVDVSLTNSDATFFYRDTLHNICRGPSLDFLAVLSNATWLPCWCLSCNLTFRSGLPRQSKFHLRSSSCLCELFDAPPPIYPSLGLSRGFSASSCPIL